MRTIFTLLVFLFMGAFAFGQTDTVHYTSDCERAYHNEVYNFRLKDNTFFADGMAEGNCCGQNGLAYTVIDSLIRISKVHEGDYCYCLCLYSFDFSIENCTLPCYRVIVEGSNVDTVICDRKPFMNIAGKAKKQSVIVYPNPATTKVTVMLTEKEKGNATFEIYNIIGQKVYSREKVTDTFEFERSNISKGAYFYKLIWKNGAVLTGKIIFE